MAWTYFTDYLEEGDILTYNQWKELIDALEERILALCIPDVGLGGDPAPAERTGMYAIIDSLIVTNKVHFIRPDTETAVTWDFLDVCGLLENYYASADDGPELWIDLYNYPLTGYTDFLWNAVNDLGYDHDDFLDIHTAVESGGLNSWKYWNVCRRAVMLLRYSYSKLTAVATAGRQYIESPAVSEEWEDVFAGYSMTSEGAANNPNGSYGFFRFVFVGASGGSYTLEGDRTETTIVIPDLDMFASYGAWLWVDFGDRDIFRTDINQSMTASFGGTSDTATVIQTGAVSRDLDFGAAAHGVGAVAFQFKLNAYDTESESEGYIPESVDDSNYIYAYSGSPEAPYWGIYLAPTFTQPYEAIP